MVQPKLILFPQQLGNDMLVVKGTNEVVPLTPQLVL